MRHGKKQAREGSMQRDGGLGSGEAEGAAEEAGVTCSRSHS